jgi:hypothetical protein
MVHLSSSANLEATDSPAPEKGARCEDLKAVCGSADICHVSFRPLVFSWGGGILAFRSSYVKVRVILTCAEPADWNLMKT